jgi:hypothetical protein
MHWSVGMRGTTRTSDQLEHLKSSLRVSSEELTQALGTNQEAVDRWLTEEAAPRAEIQARLDALEALVIRLDESFKTQEGSAAWMHSPSGYFGGLRPLDALLRGRIDAVDTALEALDSGIFV